MLSRISLLAVLLAGPALAQDRPQLLPTRDVTVTYRVVVQGQPPGEMRLSWLVARNLMRMDMPGGQGWMVLDTNAGTAFMVMDAQRMVMDIPASGVPGGVAPNPNARFTREGPARIANTECVNWRMEDQGQSARICLTREGVALRTESLGGARADSSVMEATAVTFAPQDAARFQRPAGYQGLQLPPAMGQGGMPRGTALPPPGLMPPGR